MEVSAWTDEVRKHRPGTLDQHAATIAAVSWSTLGPVLEEVRHKGEPDLLLRGAMTLLDIAVHIPLHKRPQRRDLGLATVAQDGRKKGFVSLDAHIWSARELVDRTIEDKRAPYHDEIRPHAIAWYRAATAIMAGANNLADLQPHIQRSLQMFPDEPGILFDAGCYGETFASPMMQAALARRDDQPSHTKPLDLLRAAGKMTPSLLAEAERHFRRAVEGDPSAVEARVRLGRVLTLRGRPDEAVTQLRQATTMPASALIKYYAFLFLGNALEKANDPANAAKAFGSAAGLYPYAPTPLLALSGLAAERGDSRAAREQVERALSLPDDERFDPWWFYHRGSGIEAEMVYRQFALRMQKLPGRSPDTPEGAR